MSNSQPIDVLIFEDTDGEENRIIEEMGLESSPGDDVHPTAFHDAVHRPQYTADRRRVSDAQAADDMWERIKKDIVEADPKVVVFDWLLSGARGSEPFDGLDFGIRCKTQWPESGVILVTTGGNGSLEGVVIAQEELDEQKSKHGWSIDFAWVKPWGPAGRAETGKGVTLPDWRELVGELIDRSKRPSEQ